MNFVQTAGDLLNVSKSLHHVVKVGLACVVDFLVLPVREAVAESTKLVSVVEEISWSTYASSIPLVMIESMLPLAQLFQLSAVPILTPEKACET